MTLKQNQRIAFLVLLLVGTMSCLPKTMEQETQKVSQHQNELPTPIHPQSTESFALQASVTRGLETPVADNTFQNILEAEYPTALPGYSQDELEQPTLEATDIVTSTPAFVKDIPMVKVMDKCPSRSEMNPEDLEFTATTRLIIKPVSDEMQSLWLWSPYETMLEPILKASFEGVNNDFQSISPDGKWIMFTQKDIQTGTKTLWLNSTNGGEAREVGTVDYSVLPVWDLSSQKVWVLSYVDNRDSPIPIGVIDTVSKSMSSLNDISSFATLANLYFPQVLFYDQHWYIYDYAQDVQWQVLHWLEQEQFLYQDMHAFFFNLGIRGKEEGSVFDIAVIKSETVDFVLNVKPDTNSDDYFDVMHSLELPHDGLTTEWLFWLPNRDAIAVERFTKSFASDEYRQIYVLDFKDTTLYAYCENQESIVDRPQVSLDGRFVAWTTYNDTKDVVILDVITGQRGRINGAELVGWGELNSHLP